MTLDDSGQASLLDGAASISGGVDGAIVVGTACATADLAADQGIVLARRVDAILKRTFDVVVAGTMLLTLAPVILLAALAVVLDSPGPALFRARRVGFHGEALRMLKFRKMRDDVAGGPAVTVDDDDRFTRLGAWLARTKMDEIPQLWQVLRGEMSLVGPRPEDPHFVERYAQSYSEILTVRPGITGMSQLAFAEEARILDHDRPLDHYVTRILPQKLDLDSLYATRHTIWMDMRILFWTFVAVVAGRPVAVDRRSGAMSFRKR